MGCLAQPGPHRITSAAQPPPSLTALAVTNLDLDPSGLPSPPQASSRVDGPQKLSTLCSQGSLWPLGSGEQSAILPPSPSVLLLIPGPRSPARTFRCPAVPGPPCSPDVWFPGIGLSSKPEPKPEFRPELAPTLLCLLSLVSLTQYLGPANNNKNHSPNLPRAHSAPGTALSTASIRQVL